MEQHQSNSKQDLDDIVNQHWNRMLNDPREYLILDGGTGEELFKRGVPDDRKYWSATAIIHPQYHSILRDVHTSYLHSGSNAITTNSYGIIPGVGLNIDEEDVQKYIRLAGQLARESVDQYHHDQTRNVERRSVLVLGSLGPLMESYRPDLVMDHEDGVRVYKKMMVELARNVNVFIGETLSSFEESSQVVEACEIFNRETNGKGKDIALMISYTLGGDGRLRSGEEVVDVMTRIVDYSEQHSVRLLAILFNCCEPESITKALQSIKTNTNLQHNLQQHGILLGAYANKLTPVPDGWTMEGSDSAQPFREDLSPNDYVDRFVQDWMMEEDGDGTPTFRGLQLIGGCCGISPEHISRIRVFLEGREDE